MKWNKCPAVWSCTSQLFRFHFEKANVFFPHKKKNQYSFPQCFKDPPPKSLNSDGLQRLTQRQQPKCKNLSAPQIKSHRDGKQSKPFLFLVKWNWLRGVKHECNPKVGVWVASSFCFFKNPFCWAPNSPQGQWQSDMPSILNSDFIVSAQSSGN